MSIDWGKIFPVLVSIGILIVVAIVRQYSRTVAAIAATMPINIPLALWIVSTGADDKQIALKEASEAMMINIFPTLAFIVVVWYLIRAGQSVIPSIIGGYVVWALGLGLIFGARALIGR